MIQTIFTISITLQFLVTVLHDWVDIPGWTHGRQVQAAIGPTKMLIGTLVNGLLSAPAVVFALLYWNKHKPAFVLDYWVISCAFAVLGAATSWWIPYFRGADQKTKDLYSKMYAGTLQVLPPHGDNPRPNLLHLFFHALFLINLILAVVWWFGIA